VTPRAGASLQVDGVLRTFGGITAVDNLSFEAVRGETLGIIGPNGAGKTALLNVINGVYSIEAGAIRLDGTRIDGLRPYQIAARGVARTFQSTEQVRDFRAADYVMLGRHRHQTSSIVACCLSLPGVRRSERDERALALETLDRFGLRHAAQERMSELPYGVQKLVDIARVVASEPGLMLLDEPTSGATSDERSAIAAVLAEVAVSRVTMLVIDHDVNFISTISDRLLAMNYGRLLAQGTPSEVLARPEVIEAYLGLQS
jgi:branched-chain amino acid transport system ATP-binding protein